MKGYQRRAEGKPNYWKLAVWNDRIQCWQDGKRQFDTEGEARRGVSGQGRYRLSYVEDGVGRTDTKEFVV